MNNQVYYCSEIHQKYAETIKKAHKDLKNKLKKGSNFEKVWEDHCEDQEMLSEYSIAMHSLATDIWDKRPTEGNRVLWIKSYINEYIFGGALEKIRKKEERKRLFHGMPVEKDREIDLPMDGRVEVLDVGSCYNAFQSSPQLNVTAIDLQPANQSVFKCDFTRLKIDPKSFSIPTLQPLTPQQPPTPQKPPTSQQPPTPQETPTLQQLTAPPQLPTPPTPKQQPTLNSITPTKITNKSPTQFQQNSHDFNQPSQTSPIRLSPAESILSSPPPNFFHLTTLPPSHFHVILFSLFLDYLPTPQQRFLSCLKAHHLLKKDGILIIISPDSKKQHKNTRMTRDWRSALESMGFQRSTYTKLQHLHCMAFRKTSDLPKILTQKSNDQGVTSISSNDQDLTSINNKISMKLTDTITVGDTNEKIIEKQDNNNLTENVSEENEVTKTKNNDFVTKIPHKKDVTKIQHQNDVTKIKNQNGVTKVSENDAYITACYDFDDVSLLSQLAIVQLLRVSQDS